MNSDRDPVTYGWTALSHCNLRNVPGIMATGDGSGLGVYCYHFTSLVISTNPHIRG